MLVSKEAAKNAGLFKAKGLQSEPDARIGAATAMLASLVRL